MSRVTSMSRGAARPTIVLAALAAIALSLAYLIRPTLAVATTTVYLQESQQGSNSETFHAESDCGPFGNTGGGVVWHFILNQLDDNTPGGDLTAVFTSAGQLSGTLGDTNQSVHHYWAWTPGDDILEDAWAEVAEQADPTKAKLVLSHVCHQSGGESVQESVEESMAESVPESVPESVAESVEESVQESIAESIPESIAESIPESIAESIPESIAESIPESVAESVEQSVAESAPQSVEGSVEGATGTPEASLPDGAMGGDNGSNPLPTVLFSLILLASLGTLAYANVRTVRNRS